ncbi:MAG: hypothetical protein GXW85_02980 [Clostridia bacterium]|nr:hypothetical protein [Clostridia bacterium]
MDFSRVSEITKEPLFIVKHKILSVPREDYETILKSYVDPYCEQGAQEFVCLYLASKNDPGIVGLVGVEKKGDQVVIDAAVRYENNSNGEWRIVDGELS